MSKFVCEKCDAQWRDERQFTQHMKEAHTTRVSEKVKKADAETKPEAGPKESAHSADAVKKEEKKA